MDLKNIDWNKLTPEEFRQIESEIQKNNLVKKQRKTNTKEKMISIDNKKYIISGIHYNRLKNMRSKKSIDNMKDFIKSHYPIIEDLV